jgi:hypothetical protein
MMPDSMPNASCRTLASGARQFVVHDPFETTRCSGRSWRWLTPKTTVLSAFFAGAEIRTRLGAVVEMHRGLRAFVELAGAFQHHVDALPVELGRIVGREDLDRPAAQVQPVALDPDLAGETPVHAVVLQKMRVGLDRAGGVNRHDLDIVARAFGDMRQRAAPDPPKPVDSDGDGHENASGPPMPLSRTEAARGCCHYSIPGARIGRKAEKPLTARC